jgi:hypothetical protein
MAGKVNRLVKSVSAAILATLAALTVTVSPASASSSQCPNGYFCVWTDSPYTGKFAYFSYGSNNLYSAIGGYVFAGRVTDVWNRTNRPWCLYTGVSYTGSGKWISSGYEGYTFNFNDRSLSLRAVPNPSSLSCW